MNTAFSGPQLVGVVEREQPAALIYDEEFAGLLGDATGQLIEPLRRLDRRGRAATPPSIG